MADPTIYQAGSDFDNAIFKEFYKYSLIKYSQQYREIKKKTNRTEKYKSTVMG